MYATKVEAIARTLYYIQEQAAENWSLNSIVGERGGGTGCVELLQRARGHTPWNCGNTEIIIKIRGKKENGFVREN